MEKVRGQTIYFGGNTDLVLEIKGLDCQKCRSGKKKRRRGNCRRSWKEKKARVNGKRAPPTSTIGKEM